MWRWSCPTKQDRVFEDHSREIARRNIISHALLDSCRLVHELMDDGRPCDKEGCKFIYIPSRARERKE